MGVDFQGNSRCRLEEPHVGAKRNASTEVAASETPLKALSNMEIVTLAVYFLGGQSRYVDTEDIAVKANELAPGRFTWVKYTSQINIHTIKTHLWDAKSERKGGLLLGSEKEGWMLSSSGHSLAQGVPKRWAPQRECTRKSVGPTKNGFAVNECECSRARRTENSTPSELAP